MFFTGFTRFIWYIAAYLPVALPAFKRREHGDGRKDFFNEFTLMIVPRWCIFIGEYPEGVAVMLFTPWGAISDSAVQKPENIKTLLDVRPDRATVIRGRTYHGCFTQGGIDRRNHTSQSRRENSIGWNLVIGAGQFQYLALTGESVPETLRAGETVLAGMVNLSHVVDVRVERVYDDSALSRVLEMVQEATSRKAKTELFIRRFARVYTPIVFLLALAIALTPSLVVPDYVFSDWLYRALVFLVISCPCALVISIPLSYFGGIGAASRAGILFKGANYLDTIAKVSHVVFDKTGTVTEGVFEVQHVESVSSNNEMLGEYTVALESKSNHPIARAILEHYNETPPHLIKKIKPVANAIIEDYPEIRPSDFSIENVEEIAGHGMKGLVDGHVVLAGNSRLMRMHGIEYDPRIDTIKETVVIIAIDHTYQGYLVIADRIKSDSKEAIRRLRKLGVKAITMLSGDKLSIVQDVAEKLGIDKAHGDLLPADKVKQVEELKKDPSNVVAFVGDGINDAPALALSDVGIAMGGMGSDAAIEVADVVIQADRPTKIATAIQIARSTRGIVIQNILFALGIKSIVMLLGAYGIATMWEAVFADVGVSSSRY